MGKFSRLELYFDGACDNHSKLRIMGMGVAVYVGGIYKEEYSKSFNLSLGSIGTSNISEWEAIAEALKVALFIVTDNKLHKYTIDIYGDSQLVVYQLTGKYEVKKAHLKPYFIECTDLVRSIRKQNNVALLRVFWIPRDKNKQADKLSKIGLNNFGS